MTFIFKTFSLLTDILGSFWRVLSNGPYVVLVLSGTCGLFMLISLFFQMTKYLQIQFQLSPTKASLTVGRCTLQ